MKRILLLLLFLALLNACGDEEGSPANGSVTTGLQLEKVVLDGSLSPSPTDIAFFPGTSTRFLVTTQGGVVDYFDLDISQGSINSVNIASTGTGGIGVVSGGEQGLLNIEFHPDYATNNFVFFYHTSVASTVNSISRMTVGFLGGDLTLSDPVKIIDMRKGSASVAPNHNGGGMVFAPDGTLIGSVGDGGGNAASAQNQRSLLGSVFRISPSLATGVGGYTIPSGNMFTNTNTQCSDLVSGDAGQDGCPEILAMGLRNPFRLSIDGNQLYIGDVGTSGPGHEEINSFNYLTNGNPVNFGWNIHIGPVATSGISGYKNPILSYSRTDSTADRFRAEDPQGTNTTVASIIIGDVYRGTRYSELVDGYLLHGEFMDGFIRGQGVDASGNLLGTGVHLAHHNGVSAMVQGPDGYIYITTQASGYTSGPNMVYRLVYASP